MRCFATIDDVYAYFCDLYGGSEPNVDRDWLQNELVWKRNLRYEEVTDELLGELWEEAMKTLGGSGE